MKCHDLSCLSVSGRIPGFDASPFPLDSSAKSRARLRRYTSRSSEGEARTRIGVGVARRLYPLRVALCRKATPQAVPHTPIPCASLRDFPR